MVLSFCVSAAASALKVDFEGGDGAFGRCWGGRVEESSGSLLGGSVRGETAGAASQGTKRVPFVWYPPPVLHLTWNGGAEKEGKRKGGVASPA